MNKKEASANIYATIPERFKEKSNATPVNANIMYLTYLLLQQRSKGVKNSNVYAALF